MDNVFYHPFAILVLLRYNKGFLLVLSLCGLLNLT